MGQTPRRSQPGPSEAGPGRRPSRRPSVAETL